VQDAPNLDRTSHTTQSHTTASDGVKDGYKANDKQAFWCSRVQCFSTDLSVLLFASQIVKL